LKRAIGRFWDAFAREDTVRSTLQQVYSHKCGAAWSHATVRPASPFGSVRAGALMLFRARPQSGRG